MYSIGALLLGCLYAFGFVGMFAIQRAMFPGSYFGSGEIILGLRTNMKPIALVVRVLMIVGFSILAYSLSGTHFPVYYGASLGSFLIIWPAIIAPDAVTEPRLAHKRWLLYTIYVAFIVSTIAFTRLGIMLQPLLHSWSSSYVKACHEPGWLIRFVGDTLVSSAALAFLALVMRKAGKEIEWADKETSETDQEWAKYRIHDKRMRLAKIRNRTRRMKRQR